MTRARLAEVIERADAGYWGTEPGGAEQDVRAIRNGDVLASGQIRWDELPLRGLSTREVGKAAVAPGDIVLTTSGYCGQVAFIDRTVPEGLCVTNFVRALRPRRDVVEPRFLYWLLNTDRFRRMLQPFIRGTTIKNLSFAAASVELELPLPSIEEQRRIAAILDQADAMRTRRRESIAMAESLTESIFHDTFRRSSGGSARVPVASLAASTPHSIRTGPFGSQLLHSEFVDEGIAVLGIDNAVNDKFEWGRPRFITPGKFEQLRKYEVRPGDVLVTIMATCGRVAIVPDDIPTAINTKHLCCISLDQELCSSTYLWACFRFDQELRRQLGTTARGAVMPGLNMGLIKGALVEVPPLEQQREFDRLVEMAQTLQNATESAGGELDELFASMQHRAFSGQL